MLTRRKSQNVIMNSKNFNGSDIQDTRHLITITKNIERSTPIDFTLKSLFPKYIQSNKDSLEISDCKFASIKRRKQQEATPLNKYDDLYSQQSLRSLEDIKLNSFSQEINYNDTANMSNKLYCSKFENNANSVDQASETIIPSKRLVLPCDSLNVLCPTQIVSSKYEATICNQVYPNSELSKLTHLEHQDHSRENQSSMELKISNIEMLNSSMTENTCSSYKDKIQSGSTSADGVIGTSMESDFQQYVTEEPNNDSNSVLVQPLIPQQEKKKRGRKKKSLVLESSENLKSYRSQIYLDNIERMKTRRKSKLECSQEETEKLNQNFLISIFERKEKDYTDLYQYLETRVVPPKDEAPKKVAHSEVNGQSNSIDAIQNEPKVNNEQLNSVEAFQLYNPSLEEFYEIQYTPASRLQRYMDHHLVKTEENPHFIIICRFLNAFAGLIKIDWTFDNFIHSLNSKSPSSTLANIISKLSSLTRKPGEQYHIGHSLHRYFGRILEKKIELDGYWLFPLLINPFLDPNRPWRDIKPYLKLRMIRLIINRLLGESTQIHQFIEQMSEETKKDFFNGQFWTRDDYHKLWWISENCQYHSFKLYEENELKGTFTLIAETEDSLLKYTRQCKQNGEVELSHLLENMCYKVRFAKRERRKRIKEEKKRKLNEQRLLSNAIENDPPIPDAYKPEIQRQFILKYDPFSKYFKSTKEQKVLRRIRSGERGTRLEARNMKKETTETPEDCLIKDYESNDLDLISYPNFEGRGINRCNLSPRNNSTRVNSNHWNLSPMDIYDRQEENLKIPEGCPQNSPVFIRLRMLLLQNQGLQIIHHMLSFDELVYSIAKIMIEKEQNIEDIIKKIEIEQTCPGFSFKLKEALSLIKNGQSFKWIK